MLQERPAEAALRLPETVQATVAGRLDLLSPEAKELLFDAAVTGTGFWVGALAHLSGLRTEQVERRLGELQWKELVRPQPRSWSRVHSLARFRFGEPVSRGPMISVNAPSVSMTCSNGRGDLITLRGGRETLQTVRRTEWMLSPRF